MDKLKLAVDAIAHARESIDAAELAIQDAIECRENEPVDHVFPPSPCPWMDIARGELGVKEVAGSEHNPRILEYLASTSIGKWGGSRDETAWCSAFVCWSMEGGDYRGAFSDGYPDGYYESTRSAMARSWLGWGVELDEPREGCVVVLKRGKPPSGHVGFVAEKPPRNWDGIRVLGGNQSNSVCERFYKRADILSFRWPDTSEMEAAAR